MNVAAARARFGDRVDRLAPFLFAMDPLADALAAALAEDRSGDGWQKLETALARGVAAVPHPSAAMRAFFEAAEHVPPWVDWETIDRGAHVLLRAGFVGGLVLGAKSLVYGYASPGGNKPLAFSGRLKDQAPRRLNETARFVQAVTVPGGLRPGAEGYAITLKVRLMHARVRQMLLASGRWDAARWGAPINQHDMTATLLLFSLVLLEGVRQLGVRVRRQEGEDYMHLWRYAGHLMGVDPELVSTTESDARRLGDLIAATQEGPDDDSRALAHALLDSAAAAENPRDRALAKPRQELGRALCRELVGADLADALAIPKTRFRHVVPLLRRVVRAAEVARSLPGGDARAIAAGARYWERVVRVGLGGATAEFRLPERLTGRTHEGR